MFITGGAGRSQGTTTTSDTATQPFAQAIDAAFLGSFPWKLSLEAFLGSFPWKLSLEAFLGSFPYPGGTPCALPVSSTMSSAFPKQRWSASRVCPTNYDFS